ncbi:MAG: YihY family inner membrane protein, partial [Neisseria sp.]|nr:YihY family inner membrane protein [Neisseria sp.]
MLNLGWWQDLCRTRFAGFMVFLWKRFDEVRVPQVSASLTFTTLLALVPVLTVTLVVVSAFPMFDTLSDSFVRFINQTIVPQGAGVLFDYINQFKGKASNLTAIGIVMLVVTSLLLIRTIDQTFNRIWRVQSERPLWTQFLVYWALLTFGPLAIGLSLTAWTLMLQQSRVDEMFPFLTGVLRTGSSILFSTVILWLLYRLVPNRYVPARQALVGAAVTAVLLEAARALFAWYIGTFNSYTLIYGAFAAIPVFLLWLNLLWMLVLTGAVFTAALSYWQGEA